MGRKIDIKVVSGVSAGDIFHFTVEENAPLVIGREHDCKIVLQDAYVSRRHTAIELAPEGFFISDLGSTHGTVHMGFHLRPGPEGRRALKSGDEFKVGDTIFSVHFKTDLAQKLEGKKAGASSVAGKPGISFLTKGRYPLYIGLILALLLLLLMLPENNEQGSLPAQDNQVLTLPEERIKGYWPLKGNFAPGLIDTRHVDKVRFLLPAADLVVDYEYQSEAPIEVFLDEALIEKLRVNVDIWRKRQMVVRDLAIGRDRILTLDNTDYPPKTPAGDLPLKKWRVRNVRIVPVGQRAKEDLNAALTEALSYASRIDTTPESLFLLVRSLQQCVVEALAEAGLDGVDFELDLEASLPGRYVKTDPGMDSAQSAQLDPQALTEDLSSIVQRREQGLAAQFANEQLRDLTELTAKLDTELWRRVNSRTSAALRSAEMKNYIAAHDHLQAIKNMVPDETDFRWTMAERRLNDEKIVPKKVRINPKKFRREE
ncbi:MAG TPA: FHA domain-containing protein [Oligoflexia bacterium]|nr:FHA domain-containing protein [Oligoflexia bacterium]